MNAPSVIAHRGLHDGLPENSLGAVAAALDARADAVEIDVHATSDGVVVVHHDFSLPRARGGPIPLAAIRLDDLSQWPLADGTSIPRLSDVLTLAAGRGHIHVEIKGRNIESQVMECLASSTCAASVHSFDHRIVKRCAELNGSVPRGILLESYLVDSIGALRSAAANDLWQYFELIDDALVSEVHRAGGKVIAWTVNDPDDALRLALAGVDGICTDNVLEVKAAVAGA